LGACSLGDPHLFSRVKPHLSGNTIVKRTKFLNFVQYTPVKTSFFSFNINKLHLKIGAKKISPGVLIKKQLRKNPQVPDLDNTSEGRVNILVIAKKRSSKSSHIASKQAIKKKLSLFCCYFPI